MQVKIAFQHILSNSFYFLFFLKDCFNKYDCDVDREYDRDIFQQILYAVSKIGYSRPS